MNNMLKSVQEMHKKFKITHGEINFSEQEKKFRIACMREEIDEYEASTTEHDELDALVDIVVFALGTVERQDLLEVYEKAFNRVMTANMSKEVSPGKDHRSFTLNLSKPNGWAAADLSDLVKLEEDRQLELNL